MFRPGAPDSSRKEQKILGAPLQAVLAETPCAASGRGISLDCDAPCVRSRFRHVVGELHPEEVIHVWAKRLFDAQGHFRRQRGLAVQKVGQRGAAYFQNLRRPGHREAKGFDDFGSYQFARVGRILHGHFGLSVVIDQINIAGGIRLLGVRSQNVR